MGRRFLHDNPPEVTDPAVPQPPLGASRFHCVLWRELGESMVGVHISGVQPAKFQSNHASGQTCLAHSEVRHGYYRNGASRSGGRTVPSRSGALRTVDPRGGDQPALSSPTTKALRGCARAQTQSFVTVVGQKGKPRTEREALVRPRIGALQVCRLGALTPSAPRPRRYGSRSVCDDEAGLENCTAQRSAER